MNQRRESLESIESNRENNNAANAATPPVEPTLEENEPDTQPDDKPEPVRYTPTQRQFLALFHAKRFKTSAAAEAVNDLTETFGHDKVIEVAKWAAKKQMRLGDAIIAIESALPKWGQPKQKGTKHGTVILERPETSRPEPVGTAAALGAALKARARSSSP